MTTTARARTATPTARDTARGAAHDIPLWEWIAAAIGFALLVAAVWVLLSAGPMGPSRPPAVVVRAEPPVHVADGWLVRFEARNVGSETIADVRLQATLVRGSDVSETVEAHFDFLPARSSRRGGVYFTRDPTAGVVSIRAVGYQEP